MVDEIAERRAEKAKDNRLWSPKDALEAALDRVIEAAAANKKVKLLVLMVVEDEANNTAKHREIMANCDRRDQLQMLEMSKFSLLVDWHA